MPASSDGPPAVDRLLARLCRNATPRDALDGFTASPAGQRAVVAALSTAAALRGPPPPGYEAAVLTAVARCVQDGDLQDELAAALAAALSGQPAVTDPPPRTLPPPPPSTEWRAYFFGGKHAPFPVVAAASRDFLAAGTGGAAWAAGGALAGALLARPSLVAGRPLLELGCGCGLAGAALAVAAGWGGEDQKPPPRIAPSSLTLTDGDAGALAIAAATLAANGVRGVGVARLAWGEEGEGGGGDEPLPPPPPASPSTLVLGADIMYDPAAAPHMARLLANLLRSPGTAALLAGVERARGTVEAYESAFQTAGLRFTRGLPPAEAGGDDQGPEWGEVDESGTVGWWWVEAC